MQTTIEQLHAMYSERVKADLSFDAEISIEASVRKNGNLEFTVFIWHKNKSIGCGIGTTFTEAYNRAFSSAKNHITSSVEVITINAEQL